MIENQESAYPYHDWNERINAECYEPNAVTRILDQQGRIVRIENNYQKISFNFGPTLLSWLEEYSPQVYEALLEADKVSMARFSGHGNAIAQVYNHMIMPLANRHDKITQVKWGICDFKKRFKRLPEGMWLPETAVDLDTLRILIEHGIKYTILSPRQARRTSLLGQNRWHDVSNGSIDTTMPYLVKIPSGGEISIFFYDGGISHNIAFGDLLSRGENLAGTIIAAAAGKGDVPHLIHVATDGETFGHHHKFGEMALAYCLNQIESRKLARITNYGEYLELYPPTHEVEIFENSSWSCVHGIERWRDNCGCNSGGNPGWTQAWRRPLRKAMDWLRDALIPVYESEASRYFISPRNARNDFIEVILDRSIGNIEKFFNVHTDRELSRGEKVRALKLLEMQRNAMLMYTSCGWFFDEVSGIENVQVMQYASKAIQYASEVREGLLLEPEYLDHLRDTPSNTFENAASVYEKYVKPAECNLLRVGAHYCISSIFENYTEDTRISCYSTQSDSCEQFEAGKLKFAVGKAHITSDITWDEITISFAVLHFGDQNITAGVRNFTNAENLTAMKTELKNAFTQGNIPEIVRLMDGHFGGNIYSLWHLFKDEQKKVLDQILQLTYDGVEKAYRQIYENNFTIMNFYDSLQHKIPRPFLAAAEYIINTGLNRIFEDDSLDRVKLKRLIDDTRRWAIKIDATTIAFSVNSWVNTLMEKLTAEPQRTSMIEQIIDAMEILQALSLSLNLWKAQNNYFLISRDVFNTMKIQSEQGDTSSRLWMEKFIKLGDYLRVKI